MREHSRAGNRACTNAPWSPPFNQLSQVLIVVSACLRDKGVGSPISHHKNYENWKSGHQHNIIIYQAVKFYTMCEKFLVVDVISC